MQNTLLILTTLLSGAAVASVVLAIYNWGAGNAIKKRLISILHESRLPDEGARPKSAAARKITPVIDVLSKLSIPEKGWQSSGVQLLFLQAGIRSINAPRYYFALKTLLSVVLPVLLGLFLYVRAPGVPPTRTMIFVVCTAAAGYYLPEMLLGFITRKRIGRLRDSLPDMIDLMVICTESGMGIDAAITRISKEMAGTNPDLAQEFYLSALEIRAGATRIEALRNLALRSRLEDLDDLVSVLAQADRFGTSLAESLRVQSDMMRSRRTQRAEELAAKIPVKMLLPLILFIFPTLMMVLLGPAVIQVMHALSNKPMP
ncbi:type II secretion system F family protein [Pelodictyon luteolum]|uniref:TadC protein n=1 Tax=Chlorobium luteolum (strain DSM 273 / BCRC 81028 / 2530) TaxID=319225 RepID=Q3B4R6_CHLL3|nr:type II secretion system F family protein [Pelodictyon luteolum]ABB23665.1 TadC protein [Pelodictyon luteolum DSM 273]